MILTARPCRLSKSDVPQALDLVRECGWNQVAEDWELFIGQGAAFKIPSEQGEVAATAAILPYAGFGWISMVLVGGAYRRQGLATQLMELCIAQLRERELVPVLDATPAGREVYRQLGFRDGFAITRWRRGTDVPVPDAAVDASVRARPIGEPDWEQVAALDASAFGATRAPLLRQLGARSAAFACVVERQGRIVGFLLGRDGRIATQVGPLLALHDGVAAALLSHALHRISGQVIIDVLDQQAAFAGRLPAAGFAVERGYTRMALGAAALGDPAHMVAIAGPELG